MKKLGVWITLAVLLVGLGIWFKWPTAIAPTAPHHGESAAPTGNASMPLERASDPTLTGGLEVSAPGATMIALQNKAIHRAFAKDTASVPDLAAGEYDVFATGPDGNAKVKATVRAGETTRVTLALAAPVNAVNVAGTIHDSLGGDVPGAEVWLGPTIARADGHGVFGVRIAKGDYELRVRAAGYADGTAHVGVHANTTLDFALHPASALHGVVVHADGSPAGGARVTVAAVADTFADAEGKFRLEGMNAGTYEVRAATATEIGASPRVVITPASTRDVRIELGPAVTIVGRVLAADGAPVANAEVSLGQKAGSGPKTTSARDGSYRLSPILPSQVSVEACAGDFLCGHSSQRFVAGPVTIDVILRAGSTVRLTILDTSGAPVEGAEAHLGEFEGCTSDAAGQCVIEHITPRHTRVEAHHAEKGHAQDTLDVSPGQTLHTIRLALGGSVRGTVRWDDGKPAAGVFVQDDLFGQGNVARTGPDGRYELTNVRVLEGTASLRAQATSRVSEDLMRIAISEHTSNSLSVRRVSVKAGDVLEGIDFTLKRATKTIRGTVIDANGAPVASARIGMMKEDPRVESMLKFERLFQTPDAYAGPDGTFLLEGIADGSYAVWADAEDQSRGMARNVTAGSDKVTIKLPPAASVSGEVVDDGGAPVKQFVVSADTGSTPRRVSDPAGHFAIRGVSPGKHVLSVEGASAGGNVVAQVPFETKEGEDTHLRVVMKRGITLTGRLVTWPERTPIVGTTLGVTSQFRRESTPTNGAGFFEIDGVVPGTVELYSFDVLGHGEHWKRNAADKPTFDAGDFASASFDGYGGPGFDSDGEHVTVLFPIPGTAPLAPGDELLSVGGEPVAKLGTDSLGYVFKNLRPDQSFDVKKKSGETVTLHRSPPPAPNPQNSKR